MIFFGATHVNTTILGDDVLSLLINIRDDIRVLVRKVDRQDKILETFKSFNNLNMIPVFAEPFQERYRLTLPFTTLGDFQQFNQRLATDTQFCQDCVSTGLKFRYFIF